MASDTLSNTLRAHFETAFEAIDSTTPIVWENLQKDSKGNSKRTPDPEAPTTSKYVEVFVDLNIAPWVSPGWVDRIGAVTVACYGARDVGPGHVESLVRTVERCFRKPNHTFGTHGVFQPPDITQVGATDDGWFRYNVRAEFFDQEAA